MRIMIDLQEIRMLYPELIEKATKLSEHYKMQGHEMSVEKILVLCCEYGLINHLRNTLDLFYGKEIKENE